MSHTADAGFEAWAPSLTELYAQAALALFGMIGEPKSVGSAETVRVTSVGVDREDLICVTGSFHLAGEAKSLLLAAKEKRGD